jgi:hypothetical protein
MILGVNATRSAIILARTRGAGRKFVVTAIQPIAFAVNSGDDLRELLRTLLACFGGEGKGKSTGKRPGPVIALLKCSSGRFGSCLAAIKGEAIVELAASQRGLHVVKVAPQSLKKALSCAKDQKWRDRAAELFNPRGKRRSWSKGAAAAVAAAFKIAGEGGDAQLD